MSDMKMSEVFDLPVSVDGFNLNDGHLGVEGDTTIANFDYEFVSDLSESMAHHAAHAINNHDRLVEESKQQRESLDAFRELVKAQTKTMNELNEKCKKQSKLIKEITYESDGQWYTGLHGDSDITDIVGDLLD